MRLDHTIALQPGQQEQKRHLRKEKKTVFSSLYVSGNFVKNEFTGQAWWLMLVIPALWESAASGS